MKDEGERPGVGDGRGELGGTCPHKAEGGNSGELKKEVISRTEGSTDGWEGEGRRW
jgi:hypothetical protein